MLSAASDALLCMHVHLWSLFLSQILQLLELEILVCSSFLVDFCVRRLDYHGRWGLASLAEILGSGGCWRVVLAISTHWFVQMLTGDFYDCCEKSSGVVIGSGLRGKLRFGWLGN